MAGFKEFELIRGGLESPLCDGARDTANKVPAHRHKLKFGGRLLAEILRTPSNSFYFTLLSHIPNKQHIPSKMRQNPEISLHDVSQRLIIAETVLPVNADQTDQETAQQVDANNIRIRIVPPNAVEPARVADVRNPAPPKHSGPSPFYPERES
jgi:hypothetical protein